MNAPIIDIRDGLPEIRFANDYGEFVTGHFFAKNYTKDFESEVQRLVFVIIDYSGKIFHRDPRVCQFQNVDGNFVTRKSKEQQVQEQEKLEEGEPSSDWMDEL